MARVYTGHQRASFNSLILTVYWTIFILCKEWVSAYPNYDINTLNPNELEGTLTGGQIRDRRQSSSININGQQFEASNIKGIVGYLRSVGVPLNPDALIGRSAKAKAAPAAKPQAGRSAKAKAAPAAKPQAGRSAKPKGGRSVKPKGGRSAKPHLSRGVQKEAYPRIDFQVKEDDGKGGKPGARGIDGRSAKKEVYPRIDFHGKEDDGKGTPGARGIGGRSAKKEVYPRIDFQTKEDDGKGGTPGARGIGGRSAKKEVNASIDFQAKEDDGKGTPGGRGIGGRNTKKEVYPRIDFQTKEDTGTGPTAGRYVNKPKGLGRGIAKGRNAAPQAWDGKITITFKNSKISDILMTGDMGNKLTAGTLVLKNRTENGQVVYYLDFVKDASPGAHKLLGMGVNSNDRSVGGNDDLVTEEAFVHEFDPDKLPVYVIIRNKPGEEPIYYGKIDRTDTGRMLLPSTADEVYAEDHHVFELIGHKGKISNIVPGQKRGQSRTLGADEPGSQTAQNTTLDSGEESDEDEESGEGSNGKVRSKTSSQNTKGSRGMGESGDVAENPEGKLSEGQQSNNSENGLGGEAVNSGDLGRNSRDSPGLGNDSKNFDDDRNKAGNVDGGNEAGSRSLVSSNSDKNSDNNTVETPTENASAVQRTSRSVASDNEVVKARDIADDELFQLDPLPASVGNGSNSTATNETEWPFDDDFGAKQPTFENTTGSSIVFDN